MDEPKQPSSAGAGIPRDVIEAWLEAFEVEIIEHLKEVIRLVHEQLLYDHPVRKPLLSREDLARTLNVSTRTVDSLIDSGEIQPLWVKGQRRFHPDDVEAYLQSIERRRSGRRNSRR